MPNTEISDPIPAATVVLLRERNAEVEVLMLRKNEEFDFGGMWVFPGGCIEPEDFPSKEDFDGAARIAAARETMEETGIETNPEAFVWFSQWTPPPMPRKRFRTWFFAAQIPGDEKIEIDGDEIHDHQWINPGEALNKQKSGDIKIVPPTWLTLYYLNQYASVDTLLKRFSSTPPKAYQTRVGKTEEGHRTILWRGDAGYDAGDATLPGDRHRLVIQGENYVFENTIEHY
ncbi:MAG: NUDIX hydrolase [Pseudomonadales bacterium]|nr:NUDIX hydrolase [Pseudomonadales bacterium]